MDKKTQVVSKMGGQKEIVTYIDIPKMLTVEDVAPPGGLMKKEMEKELAAAKIFKAVSELKSKMKEAEQGTVAADGVRAIDYKDCRGQQVA